MKLAVAAAVALFGSIAFAQPGPAGHWEGTFTVNSREIRLSLDLAKDAKSEWTGSMGLPADNMTGLVVMNIAVSGDSVKFTAVELGMAKFDLTLAGDKLKGTVATPQGAMPVDFQRTGDAKVELIPASPAVSKELEGDWEGDLQTPARAFKILLHFKNRPDQTVAATIDTPDSGGMNLPLNNVKQTGDKVEFGIKIAHSTFQGTLNPEATQLTGQWTHEAGAMPITLKKR
jgi:hypothetical protein